MTAASATVQSPLLALYDALPPSEQRRLVTQHLAPLVDQLPQAQSSHIFATASAAIQRASLVPSLNLKQRKAELRGLLIEIDRDAKRAILIDRSRKDELLEELAHSLASWIPIIWSVAYEYKSQFDACHRALSFSVDLLKQVAAVNSGCKCSFTTMYLPVTIKKQSGRVVKNFELEGAHQLEEVIFWTWRDMFLTLLASEEPRISRTMKDMIEEMEEALGWKALERMLYGGQHEYSDSGDESESDASEEAGLDEEDASNTENGDDDDDDHPCRCSFHARHWSRTLNAQVVPLREHVINVLRTSFSSGPSLELYAAITALSPDQDQISRTLRREVRDRAATGPDALAAALEVHTHEGRLSILVDLLDQYKHLLRPRDGPSLRLAANALSVKSAYRPRAFDIARLALYEVAKDAGAAIRSAFPGIETAEALVEMGQILALRMGTPGRAGRIERWAESAIGPAGPGLPHAMAFAAAMMGVPVPQALGGAAAEADTLLGLDPDDPDLDDLREEYRPRLKQRWNEWTASLEKWTGNAETFNDVYIVVIRVMPFLQASDVVEELIARLVDRPSKHHVCDILEALSSFVKAQQKKARAKEKKEKKCEASAAPPSNSTGLNFGALDDVD